MIIYVLTSLPRPAAHRSSSVRRRANAFRVYNTEPLPDLPPSPTASDRRRAGHGDPSAESAPVDRASEPDALPADAATSRYPAGGLNPTGGCCGPLRLH
jgi:hypothetical protein